MKLFFRQSLWDKRAIEPYGSPQKVNWQFDYINQQYIIPMIYLFSEGIAFDIINILDNIRTIAFLDKYKSLGEEVNEEAYTCLQAESPIQELSFREIHINDQAVEIAGVSSGVYLSDIKDEGSPQLKEMYQEYDFLQGEDVSFKVTRIHLKYLQADQSHINELRLFLVPIKTLLPIKKHFTVEINNSQADYPAISFNHPSTNLIYSLHINEIKEFNPLRSDISNNPQHFMVTADYELIPPLADNETIIIKDIEAKIEDGTVFSRYDLPSPAIVIYQDKKMGIMGYPLELAASKAYPGSIKYIKFSIVGIEREASGEEILLKANKETI